MACSVLFSLYCKIYKMLQIDSFQNLGSRVKETQDKAPYIHQWCIVCVSFPVTEENTKADLYTLKDEGG